MPHTFNNIHTVRRSHNATLPVNHKATRMHTKIALKFFPREIDIDDDNDHDHDHWNDLQISSIVQVERDLQEVKKSCKKTSHRVSREKSLPKTRLERQIKKQIFFKKSRRIEEEFIEESVVMPVADEDYDLEEYYDTRFRRFEEMLCLPY